MRAASDDDTMLDAECSMRNDRFENFNRQWDIPDRRFALL